MAIRKTLGAALLVAFSASAQAETAQNHANCMAQFDDFAQSWTRYQKQSEAKERRGGYESIIYKGYIDREFNFFASRPMGKRTTFYGYDFSLDEFYILNKKDGGIFTGVPQGPVLLASPDFQKNYCRAKVRDYRPK